MNQHSTCFFPATASRDQALLGFAGLAEAKANRWRPESLGEEGIEGIEKNVA
jgi:hypothetical protein